MALDLGYLKISYVNFGLVFWISCCKIKDGQSFYVLEFRDTTKHSNALGSVPLVNFRKSSRLLVNSMCIRLRLCDS